MSTKKENTENLKGPNWICKKAPIISEINNMLVSDEYRGYGIGKSLINNFKEYCKSNNISNIKVVASYKNQNAVEFYHKNGFEEFDITLTTKI